ncbi:MAG: DUF6011 domain-containing protein [Promethearchaeota archaeon]
MSPKTCKRCGKILTSQESIERGYGPRCFKIVHLQANSRESKLETEVNFLKCEINMIKRQLKQAQNYSQYQNINPIERIQKEEDRPERDSNKINFNVVIKELKVIFNRGNPRENLVHIPEEEIKIYTRNL